MYFTSPFRCILSVLGLLMVIGTLYDVMAVQMQRSSSENHESMLKDSVVTKAVYSNGSYVSDSAVPKEALFEKENGVNGIAKAVEGPSEVTADDVKVVVGSNTKLKAKETPRGKCATGRMQRFISQQSLIITIRS